MIYLDNAATTKPCQAAINAMIKAGDIFGNPSSLHGLGLAAEKEIRAARETIASMMSVNQKDIYFTSGGTEANNTVIFGVAEAKKKIGNHLITTKIEHPSVLSAFKKLESEGYRVTYLNTDKDGRISIDELKQVADKDTILISIMHVNNETGVVQPIEQIKDAVSEIAPNALVHADCVQSFGKLPVTPKKYNLDFVSISSHKIHGYKGTGAVYIKDIRNLRPLLHGGEQQGEIRPGTENVGGILAFAAAAKECVLDSERMRQLRIDFKNMLSESILNIQFNGSDEYNSGSVLNVSFIGIKAEILLHSLEVKGIYVSTGSACSSHKPQPSHVLVAMGVSQEAITGAVRFSFDHTTTKEELEEATKIIAEETATIRRFM